MARERDSCLRNNPLWLFNFSSEFFFFRLSGIGVIGARRVLLIISKSPYTLCAVYLPNAKYFVHFPRFLALTSL